MEFSFSALGMGLIIASWIIQIIYTLMHDKKMTWIFALLQAVGIVLLVVDLYKVGSMMTTLSYLNVASAVGAFVMFVLALLKK